MQYWRRNLLVLWLSQLTVNIGFQAAQPFIPFFMKDALGITDTATRALLMSRYYFYGMLAYAIFTPLWGVLGDRYGVKLMLYRGSFLPTFLYPLMGFAPNYQCLLALRFIIGALSGTTVAAQMLLVKTTPNERQGFALGVLGTAIWGGAMMGDMVGGLVVYYLGYKATFTLCGLLFFVSGLMITFAHDSEKSISSPTTKRSGVLTFITNFKNERQYFSTGVVAMLAIIMLSGVVQRVYMPYTSLMVERACEAQGINLDKAAYWTGFVNAFAAAGAMLSGVILGALADKMQEWKLTTPAQLLSSAMLFISAGAVTLFSFGAAHAINTFAVGGLYSVFQKITASLVPTSKRGMVLGCATMVFNIGLMIAALLSGSIAKSSWGLSGVYYYASCAMLVFSFITMFTIRYVLNTRDRTAVQAQAK